jgi:hypothetical protein
MRKQTAYKEPDAKNSLCRALGHDWMTTATANWRVCKRTGCRASERLVNGQWVSNAQAYRTHTPVVGSARRQHRPRQNRMWDDQPAN